MPAPKRRPNETRAGKNSFCASPKASLTLARRRTIHAAIDESLCAVRFNAQDTRSVLDAVRTQPRRRAARKRRPLLRVDLLFTCALAVMIALPLTLYALRARESITHVITSPALPAVSLKPDADLLSPPPSAVPALLPTALPSEEAREAAGLLSESEAIRIARDCFNAQCDTAIYTFEEYEIRTALNPGEMPQYTVFMDSIYNNGCAFTVILCAQTGEILQYSSPKLATVPAAPDNAATALPAQ